MEVKSKNEEAASELRKAEEKSKGEENKKIKEKETNERVATAAKGLASADTKKVASLHIEVPNQARMKEVHRLLKAESRCHGAEKEI